MVILRRRFAENLIEMHGIKKSTWRACKTFVFVNQVCKFCCVVAAVASLILNSLLGSLSNHDDDDNKNPTNLHNWQWKTVFLHALHVHFSFFWHFVDVLVLSTTSNDLFCSCVDDVSIWWQMFNFVFLCPMRWFQFNSRIVRTHFWSIMTLNNWKMIAETRSHIFRWRSCFCRRRVCLSSLLSKDDVNGRHSEKTMIWLVEWEK